MQNFAAIDFETANNERSSVCSIGIVIVRGEEIVDTFYSLIKQNTIIIGAVRYMACAAMIQLMPQYFPKSGNK